MNQFRCQCKKIICQIEGDVIIIKCRHCKRYLHIVTEGIKEIQFKLDDQVEQVAAANDG
jgi:hypothetical protein